MAKRPQSSGEIVNGVPLAHGSTPPTERLRAAGIRACDSYASIRRRAEKLYDELDEITSPHGVPTTDLGDEDSAVIAVREARDSIAPKG